MFLEHGQAKEIQAELQQQNISISVSEVEYLSKKFIIYLSIVQERNTMGIIDVMDANGGYILHIDALGGSKGGERLICGVDGITKWILGNAKIKSEHSAYVKPFLGDIKGRFGKPLCIVQDMGRGIMKGVREVFPGTKILICHFHFLRDIGKDLLEENYDVIRKRLRHFGFLTTLRNLSKTLKLLFANSQEATNEFCLLCSSEHETVSNTATSSAIYLYTLIEYILDWKSQSNGYGFPFDRPHLDLALRINEVVEFLNSPMLTTPVVREIQLQLKAILEEISQDEALKESVKGIHDELTLFDKLRSAMRIAPENGTDGLNDDGSDVDIKAIENGVDTFIAEQKTGDASLWNIKMKAFMKQLDKYREQLFSDPIFVETATGIKKIQPQRTNNLMERMFRDFSRDNKRKTGVDSIGNTIRAMVADTPVVRNLKDEHYRKIIIGENESLAEAFAEIDIDTVRRKMKEHDVCNEAVPKNIKTILRKNNALDILANIRNRIVDGVKSN